MKKFYCTRRITAYVLLISSLICLCLLSAPDALAADDPDIQAAAAVLIETHSGKVLYDHNANTRRAPASLTKIMTAMLAVEAYEQGKFKLNDVITVSQNAYCDVIPDGSTIELKVGEEMTFQNLIYAALMASANEACNVLAENISGDVESFIALMNSRVKELGCKNTHFANAHGLPDDEHYSTAYDMYIIADNAMKLPLFAKIVNTANYTIPATNMSAARELTTTNNLINPESRYYFDLAGGVKTGYTTAAGYCLVASAENEEMNLISVVMGTESYLLEDGTTEVGSFAESRRLLKWGFDSFSYQTILSTLDLIAETPVALGDGTDSVVLRPEKNISVLLDSDIDLSARKLDVHIFSEENGEELIAPISQGDVMGSVSISLDGVDYGTVQLVANTSVDLNKGEYLRLKIKNTFKNKYVKLLIALLVILLISYIAFIIIYNKNRKRKIRIAEEVARRKIQEIRRREGSTIGKSFEEIEKLHSRK